MQLVIDVGNTETVVGVVAAPLDLVAEWRLSSGVPRTGDEMTALLRAFLAGSEIDEGSLRHGVLGSVVPSVNHVWNRTVRTLTGRDAIAIGPDSPLPIELDVDEPKTVGADRIVNTLAARILYERDTIAVDLGTATTFDCITGDGVFVGGVIAPGVKAGLDWLAARTAKLPRVELAPPASVVGRRTEECIQSGVFYQSVDSIDGIVGRIKAEWGRPDAYVVATGGLANAIGPHLSCMDAIEPFLTLYGLALAGDRLGS